MAQAMDRIYRVRQSGESFYAVERGGALFRAGGDIFNGVSVGEPIRGGLSSVQLPLRSGHRRSCASGSTTAATPPR